MTCQWIRKWVLDGYHAGTYHPQQCRRPARADLRSLQRKLHEQDTSFKELLSNTQQELALFYIRDSNRSIGEITYLLGFSEPSNFTRAFKRWTGQSPAEYRENH